MNEWIWKQCRRRQSELPATIWRPWCNEEACLLANWHILQAILHLPLHTNTHTHSYAPACKICSAMIAIIISDQLCYWMWAAIGPVAWESIFCRHRWCGSTWLDVMDGEEMVMSETVQSPARSQLLNNYRRVVQPSLNKCSNVDIFEFRWESFKCILFLGTWDSWGLDFWSLLSIHSFVRKAPLIPNPGGWSLILQDLTLCTDTHILRGAI